jgi:hypothetical protein
MTIGAFELRKNNLRAGIEDGLSGRPRFFLRDASIRPYFGRGKYECSLAP